MTPGVAEQPRGAALGAAVLRMQRRGGRQQMFEATAPSTTPPRHTPGAPRADHLAFGHGMHYCSGAALARLETVALLDAFCRRHPQARVHDSTWGKNRTYRGFDRLGVDVSPSAGK
ncbi:hypothetical protein [Streptomyces sp. NPDC097610]|uniref:hypothetical protein n=1 Tax=Streptomyces sp. NPDC097610 TaxID=3157227 RepID=UPI003333F4AC